jgi:hypothetical protein
LASRRRVRRAMVRKPSSACRELGWAAVGHETEREENRSALVRDVDGPPRPTASGRHVLPQQLFDSLDRLAAGFFQVGDLYPLTIADRLV